MDSQLALLLKLLGLGSIVLFISRLELADKIYQSTRSLPTFWADIGAVLTIGIILFAVKTLESEK